jgi:hypothetical protein
MTNTPATLEGPANPKDVENNFLEQGFTNLLAVIIDGVVQDIMATKPRAAAILTSNPIIIDTTHISTVAVGYTYNETTNSFSRPVSELN